MQEKLMKKFALTDYLLSEQGFTYVSMFISITIISVTLPFFAYILQLTNLLSSNYQELSTQQFFQILRDEVISSEEMRIENNKLKLAQGDSTAIIEQYGSLIRRQVNGVGHEILLQNVDTVIFSPSPYGVNVNIKNIEGNSYGKTIVFYK